jgi:hypothetical protein
MDPALRILARAIVEVACGDADMLNYLQLSIRMHGCTETVVRPYFEALSDHQRDRCLARAAELAAEFRAAATADTVAGRVRQAAPSGRPAANDPLPAIPVRAAAGSTAVIWKR